MPTLMDEFGESRQALQVAEEARAEIERLQDRYELLRIWWAQIEIGNDYPTAAQRAQARKYERDASLVAQEIQRQEIILEQAERECEIDWERKAEL